MAITTVTLNDTMVGTIISPGPDQFITYLKKTHWTPYQADIENWFVPPYPHGIWRSDRFVLRESSGRRIFSFGKETSGVFLVTPTRFAGDLVLECLPAGEEWRIDFSDTPVTRSQAWAWAA